MSALALAVVAGRSQSWRDLYRKALFETHQEMIVVRIREAETALVFRARELFVDPHSPSEREAINTALHALHDLEACAKSRRRTMAA